MARARKAHSAGPTVWLLQLGLPLLAGVALVGGILWLGRLARDDIRRRGGPSVTFAEIECQPPEQLTRAAFLAEAQYLAGLPDRLDLLDETTAERVRRALEGHPWVAKVDRVRVSPDGVKADLHYRQPVLWVGPAGRAVDAAGVLLPVAATRDGLPVLVSRVTPPAGRPGQPWGDLAVEGAARVFARLGAGPRVFDPGAFTVEVRDGVLTLRYARRRIVWGGLPGVEQPGEPDAEAKAMRLLSSPRGEDLDLRK